MIINTKKITLDIIKNENIIKIENKRRRNLMKTEIAEVFMNPVRQRIIQYLEPELQKQQSGSGDILHYL